MNWAWPRSKEIEYHTYTGRNGSVSKVTILNHRSLALSLEGGSSLWLVNTQDTDMDGLSVCCDGISQNRKLPFFCWQSQHWAYILLYLTLFIGQSTQSLYICFSESGDNPSSLKEMMGRLRLEVAQRCYSICCLTSATLSWMIPISKWCMAILFLKFISPNSEAIVC